MIFIYILLKTLIVGTGEAVLTSTRNLCFGPKIKKKYPCQPHFYYTKMGNRGYSLHGHVCMMNIALKKHNMDIIIIIKNCLK